MVSIVLTTYNSIKYLKFQLDSLKNQTYKDFEVVISDDCSTDGTNEYVKEYIAKNSLKNWKLYTHDTNVGYALNFKQGIEKASGSIIFLCDHDDIWYSDKLEKYIYVFSNKPNVQLLGGSFVFIDKDGKELNNTNGLIDFLTSNHKLIKYHYRKNSIKKITFKKNFTYSFTPGCLMAFRSDKKNEVISSIGKAPHDFSISLLFSNYEACFFYNKPFIKYRIHENNQIGIKDKNDIQERIEICKKDILDREDILEHLGKVLSKSNYKYSIKFINLLENRLEALQSQDKRKLFIVLIKSLFYKRYFFTIVKDFSSF